MTFVLVPGAGGQAWYWHRVVGELERRGHTAIAVELPAGDDGAGWAEYADAVVAAAAGVTAPVVVGQSMGGFTAPVAAVRLGARAIVLVNAMIPVPGETGGEWWASTGQGAAHDELAAAQGRPIGGDFDVVAEFFHDVPADITAEAMAEELAQSDTPFAQAWPLPAWPAIPTVVVAGRDDRLFPPSFQRRVAAERLGLPVVEVPGGHLVALSRPVELADALVSVAEAPILLRDAASGDEDAIAVIWHVGWRDGHVGHVPDGLLAHRDLSSFRRRVPGQLAATTVGVRDGDVVGFVTVVDDEVEQMYVDRRARASGAADVLLAHGEVVVAADHDEAWLAVVDGNARARRFYERNGWRDAGPLAYEAAVDGGTFAVPTRRYVKRVR